jgi:hypothetical protein
MSTILLIRLAAAKILAEREFLQITENIENFLKLRIRTRIPAKSKRDGKYSKSEQTIIRTSA